MRDKDATGRATQDYRWVFRFSTIAFFVLTSHQMYGVTRLVPRMQSILRGFGAELPERTTWAIENHIIGCILIALASLVSTSYLLVRQDASPGALKVAYSVSLVSLVAAFAWSGWIQSAMIEPIFQLGAVV